MKKNTLALITFLALSVYVFSQTYSTGMIQLSITPDLQFSAQIDVTSSEVTLTLIGRSDRWFGLGFDTTSMTNGKDVVIFDGSTLTDRSFLYVGVPPENDIEQDWTIISNTVAGNFRTLVATRALNTGHLDDYVFSPSNYAIDLVWAFSGNSSFTVDFANFHFENYGVTVQSFTLGDEEVSQASQEFTISPNPAKNKLNIRLPQGQQNAVVNVYDVLGKRVYSKELNSLTASIDVSKWNTGVYLVKVSANNFTQTRRFVKQ